jgi:hypothetical protein
LSISDTEIDNNDSKIEGMLKEIQELRKTLVKGGVYDRAKVKSGFEELTADNEDLVKYAKIFYWTLLNYFAAYRSISTGLV